MIGDILDNDDYSKKIEELQRILSQEKAHEDDVDEKENEKFINERDKLINNYEKEIQNLEREISKLKEENKNNKYFIDISNNEINKGSLELLKNRITENIYNKINEYMKGYEKNVKIKINEINTNAKLLQIINDANSQINTNIKDINDINDKLNDYLIKQKNIMENIKKIKKELNLEIENKKENVEDGGDDIKIIEKKKSNKSLKVDANKYDQKQNEFNRDKIYDNLKRVQKKTVDRNKNNDDYINNIIYNEEPLDNNKNYEKFINSGISDKKINKIEYVNTEKEDEIPNEFEENNNIKIMKNNNREKNNFYGNWKNITGLVGANKNNEPIKPINVKRADYNLEEEKKKKKKIEYNSIFNIMNNIFFINNEQNLFKFEKIKEQYKGQIYKLYSNDLKNNSKETSTYCLLFIKNNVLPIFKNKRNYDYYNLEIIKSNISTVLKTIGINENYFIEFYNPQTVVEKKYDRNKSIEARINFRKKFGVGEDVILDKELERRLEYNGLNIDQTFKTMYG